jgi:hypothetical protein
MFRKLFIVVIALLFVASSAKSTEHTLIVKPKQDIAIGEISRLCSIERILPGGFIRVNVIDSELPALLSVIESYDTADKNVDKTAIVMSQSKEQFLDSFDTYPTLQQYKDIMNDFSVNHPELCTLDTIGYSTLGKPLIVARITGTEGFSSGNKTQALLVGSIHGDECIGYVNMLRLIDYFINLYNAESVEGERATKILNNMELYILPLLNPDGTYYETETSVDGSIRRNAREVDLNRSFPDRVYDSVNTTEGREAETAAMMEFVARKHIALSAVFHTGTYVANYPWDSRSDGKYSSNVSNCPDSLWYKRISMLYAGLNPGFTANSPFTDGITVGTAWYPVYGGHQDWIYIWHRSYELTIEIADDGIPPASELPMYWEQNKESTLAFLEHGMNGIHGTVSDEAGKPLKAKITLLEIPEIPVYSDSATGSFTRYVDDGLYNLVASCEGYEPDTLKNIPGYFNELTPVEFTLKMIQTNVEEITQNRFAIYPNPAMDCINIESFTDEIYEIELFDQSGRQIVIDGIGCGEECGSTSLALDYLPNGYYVLMFKTHNKIEYHQFIKL